MAAALRRDTDAATHGMMASLVHRYLDSHFESAPELLRSMGDPAAGVVSDVNLSNLGRYPFPTTHTFPGTVGAVHMVGHHLVNSASPFGCVGQACLCRW